MQEGAWSLQAAYDYATQNGIPPSVDDGETIYTCPFAGCCKTFSKRFNLKAHLRVHTGDKPFACSIPGCTRRFMWKSSLTSHEVGHSRRAIEADRRGSVPLVSEISAIKERRVHRSSANSYSRLIRSHAVTEEPVPNSSFDRGAAYANQNGHGPRYGISTRNQTDFDKSSMLGSLQSGLAGSGGLLPNSSQAPSSFEQRGSGRGDFSGFIAGEDCVIFGPPDVKANSQHRNALFFERIQPTGMNRQGQDASRRYGHNEVMQVAGKSDKSLFKQEMSAALPSPSNAILLNDRPLAGQAYSGPIKVPGSNGSSLPHKTCRNREHKAEEEQNLTGRVPGRDQLSTFAEAIERGPYRHAEPGDFTQRPLQAFANRSTSAVASCSLPNATSGDDSAFLANQSCIRTMPSTSEWMTQPASLCNVSSPHKGLDNGCGTRYPESICMAMESGSGNGLSSGPSASVDDGSGDGCQQVADSVCPELSPSLPLTSPKPIHVLLSPLKPNSNQIRSTLWAEASGPHNFGSASFGNKFVCDSLPSITGSGTSTSPHAGSVGSSLGSPGVAISPIPPPLRSLKEAAAAPRRPRGSIIRQSSSILPPISSVTPAAPPQHIDLTGLMDDDTAGPLPPPLGSTNASPCVAYSPGSIAQGGFRFSPMPISPLQPFSAGPLLNDNGLCESHCPGGSLYPRGKQHGACL